MRTKRTVTLLVSALLAFCLFQIISAQSLAENEWYLKSKEYLAMAQEAFAQGDYDKGNEYAQLADEYAQKAEDEGNKMLIKYKASASRAEAEAYLNKARDLGAETNPNTQDLFQLASQEYDDGKAELDKAAAGNVGIEESQPMLTEAIDSFHSSTNHSKNAIAAIQDIAVIDKLMQDTKQGRQTLLAKGYIEQGDEDDSALTSLMDTGQEAYDAKNYVDAKEYLSQAKTKIDDLMHRGEARDLYDKAEKALNQADSEGLADSHPDEFASATDLLALAKVDLDNGDYQPSMDKSQKVIDTLMVFSASMGGGDILPKYYKVRLLSPRRDCFSKISGYNFVYGDEYKWRILYEANKDKIPDPNNPHLILVGAVIEIPSIKGEKREGTYSPDKKYTPISQIKGTSNQ
jgi:nucleoid-associated protein YgaU